MRSGEAAEQPLDPSTQRLHPQRGWTSGKKREHCRCGCGARVPYGRRTFASADCVRGWKVRTQPAFAAALVLERDGGVCAICKLNCCSTLRELRALSRQDHAAWTARVAELELPPHLQHGERRLWEMDHTVPVVEGGGSCGIENLRTLCWRDHARVTAELAARRAEQRRTARADRTRATIRINLLPGSVTEAVPT